MKHAGCFIGKRLVFSFTRVKRGKIPFFRCFCCVSRHFRYVIYSKRHSSRAILHLLGYVGAPLVREALLVAKETFAEMRAENPVTS